MSNFILDQQYQEEIYQLYLYAFNAQDSANRRDFWNRRFQHAIPYGISVDGQIETSILSIPFETNFFGTNLKMNGISDVMSAPEASGKGGASQLMKAALQDMYDNQVTLSYLAPFAFSYYRRFGYEQVFDHVTYTMASDKLPRISKNTENVQVKRLDFSSNTDLLKSIYQQSPLAQRGGLNRADWWWDYLPKKFANRQLAVAFEHQQPTGYVIYERTASEFIIYEVANTDIESRQALWKFVTKHGTTAENFIYQSPVADIDFDLVDEPYSVTTTVQLYMMARIVNLQDFLEKYPTSTPAKFTLDVIDDVLSENNGHWTFEFDGKVRSVQKSNVPLDTHTAITIQQLTKILFGYRSAASLVEHGKIVGWTSDNVKNLDAITVPQKPILADYF